MAEPARAPSRRRAATTRPGLRLALQFVDPADRTLITRAKVGGWIRAALDRPAEITVRIVGTDEARRLNREFRGKDAPTNVLTFDYATDPVVVADLVLCAPVLRDEAAALGVSLEAHYAHLLVHGTLHAQGRDHEAEAEAEAMEAEETRILAGLGIADPYAGREVLVSSPAAGPGSACARNTS